MDSNKVKPFDSFTAVYKVMIWAGYFRLLGEHSTYIKQCHKLYRPVAFAIVVIYILQNLVYIVQPDSPSDVRMEGIMIEIPQFNCFAKVLVLTLCSSRIEKINEMLDDPFFAPNGEVEEQYLLKNVKEMHLLSRTMNIFVTIATVCWPLSHILQRLRDSNTVIPFYVPFKADTWTKYIMLVVLQVLPMLWIGYGHVNLDCLVVTYYSQAQVQLKIIKYKLMHLFDVRSSNCYGPRSLGSDTNEEELYTNFVYLVKRYEKLVWYINEVNSVFNPSITAQFLTSSVTLCMVIYKMSETDVLSVAFLFLMVLICILLIQIFMYCYYGNLVTHESESINTWLYLSGWRTASPRFRRALLIAMSRWSKPLTAQVAGIIPLALDSFITIIKFSYTLYTVLSTKPEINESTKMYL